MTVYGVTVVYTVEVGDIVQGVAIEYLLNHDYVQKRTTLLDEYFAGCLGGLTTFSYSILFVLYNTNY